MTPSTSPLPEFDPAQLVLVGLWALYVAGWICYSLGMDLLLIVLLVLVVVVIAGGAVLSHWVWLLLLILLLVWLFAGVGRRGRY